MNQLQFNGKTSTKRPNSSASSYGAYGAEAQKKTRLVSQTPRLILPKPVLTEPQPQNIILQSQQQQQSVLSEPPQQHQQRSQLQKQQQRIFPSQHPPFQEQYVFQQQYDPQIPHLSSTLIELDEKFKDEDDKISQPKKTDEKSGWKNSEIEILLDYLQENFTSWSKGNKTKFYNDITKNILPNKEAIAIKSKLARLIKKYESVKKHNNQSGVERKDWEWYDRLDIIFGTRENISPSFLANKSTDFINENIETKKVNNKKQKNKNNVEVMTEAITEMNQTREKIWEQKMTLEKEKLDKSHELERE